MITVDDVKVMLAEVSKTHKPKQKFKRGQLVRQINDNSFWDRPKGTLAIVCYSYADAYCNATSDCYSMRLFSKTGNLGGKISWFEASEWELADEGDYSVLLELEEE